MADLEFAVTAALPVTRETLAKDNPLAPTVSGLVANGVDADGRSLTGIEVAVAEARVNTVKRLITSAAHTHNMSPVFKIILAPDGGTAKVRFSLVPRVMRPREAVAPK